MPLNSFTPVAAEFSSLPPLLRLRREPFEFGLLPFAPVTHHDTVAVNGNVSPLLSVRNSLLSQSASLNGGCRVSVADISKCLALPELQCQLIVDSLASLLPVDVPNPDPSSVLPAYESTVLGADVYYLMLFLHVQSYKRPPHRLMPSSSAMADIWPQPPSAFDSVQAKTAPPATVVATSSSSGSNSNSRGRGSAHVASGAASLADDEAIEVQFVQKSLLSMLSLLADGEEGGKQTISPSSFERLNFFLKPMEGEASSVLSQLAPFFSAASLPVPVEEVHSWLLQHISAPSASPESESPEEPGARSLASLPCVVENVTKSSVLRGEKEVQGSVMRISHCHDAVIYALAPLRHAAVTGCSDSIVVLGPVAKSVKCDNCERVQIITASARVRISNCRECVFYLGVNSRPVVSGDNHKLQLAPYNTFYPRLESHLQAAGVNPAVNQWDSPVTLRSAGLDHSPVEEVEPSPSSPDSQITLMPPDRFVPFVIPFRSAAEGSPGGPPPTTRGNPFALPRSYLSALQLKTKSVESLRQTLKVAVLEDSKKKELTNVIQAHFKEWLLSSGNIRQVYDLAKLDKEL